MSAARSRRRSVVAVAVAVAVTVVAAVAAAVPTEVRHSAPFGSSSTFDADRLIAVRGGHITPNYDDFDRLDLDLRAYTAAERYDLTIHVRPAGRAAPDLRTIPLSVEGEEIWHRKAAFSDPFVTVRFPAIQDSAGKRYYVWVEAGPRNRDDIWTLWSIKSFSRVPAYEVLAALIDAPPEPLGGAGRVVLILLIVGTVGSAAWLVAATATASGGDAGRAAVTAPKPVAPAKG